jgi:predicted negative regulator of RcsB-dependent stress response
MSSDSQDTPRPIGEIIQGPSAFDQFLDRNQKNLIILTIIIAVAAASVVIYRGTVSSKEHTAGAEFNKADDLTSLQGVIRDHSGTAAAESAQVLLAARQWSDGQPDTAIATLQAFIAANPEHPARPTAQASLGAKLQTQGKLAEAKKVFQDLADDPGARFLAPYALLALGDISKAAGETEQAAKLYQKAKTDFPDSSFGNTIGQRIAMLKAQMPAEIDAPPPPPKASVTPAVPSTTAPSAVAVPPAGSASTPEADVPPVNNPYINPPAGQPPVDIPPAGEVTPALPKAAVPVQETPEPPRSAPAREPAAPASPASPATPPKP